MRIGASSRRLLVGSAVLTFAWVATRVVPPPEGVAAQPGALAAQTRRIPVIPPPSARTLNAYRTKIQHIVFIIKENRTFDTYFGTFPGADGATSGIISSGQRIPLRHAPDRMPRDIGHDWEDARRAIDDGRMD